MKTYSELKQQQPVLTGCFYAFNKQQFAEGIAEQHLEGAKIYSAGAGLYGTDEGISALMAEYDAIYAEIAATCNPQDVYDYEYDNHECGYTGDDTEAVDIVTGIFGAQIVETLKRH